MMQNHIDSLLPDIECDIILKKPYNVFYTDDDDDDQDIFREVALELNDAISIFTQSNGAQLMHVLQDRTINPDIIFLDLNMPLITGFDVLTEIRKLDALKTLPVIIFSTSVDAYTVALTQKLGATMYISKPNSYTHLKVILHHVFSIEWITYKAQGGNFLYEMKSQN